MDKIGRERYSFNTNDIVCEMGINKTAVTAPIMAEMSVSFNFLLANKLLNMNPPDIKC